MVARAQLRKLLVPSMLAHPQLVLKNSTLTCGGSGWVVVILIIGSSYSASHIALAKSLQILSLGDPVNGSNFRLSIGNEVSDEMLSPLSAQEELDGLTLESRYLLRHGVEASSIYAPGCADRLRKSVETHLLPDSVLTHSQEGIWKLLNKFTVMHGVMPYNVQAWWEIIHGRWAAARQLLQQFTENFYLRQQLAKRSLPAYYRTLAPLLSNECPKAIGHFLHGIEAENVRLLGLEKRWQPSLFPFEAG